MKSSVGLGIILHEGIGNTIRVSLTGDPVEEIRTAKLILMTLVLPQVGQDTTSIPPLRSPSVLRISFAVRRDGSRHSA